MAATFLDLLRAKVAIQLGLLEPPGARAALVATDELPAPDGEGLLAVLRARSAAPGATGEASVDALGRVDRHARRCLFLKGESFYLRLLRGRELVPEDRLQPLLWQVRHQQDGRGLGATLVARGLLDAPTHAELQEQAERAAEEDNRQITGRYRERAYEGIERASQMVSQVIAEEEAAPAAAVATSSPAPGADAAPPAAATPAEPQLPPELAGTGLDERYLILRKLGEGGMGVVYLAYERDDPARERPMALKVVRDVAKSKDAAARFKREILATSFCAHENIIEIYDAAETQDGSYYMAMEYIEGDELADLIKRDGPLSLDRVVRLMGQALEGLEAMHQSNIVHKDIKPQNFRITHDAEGEELLKIVDFGIARVLDAEDSGAGDQFYRTMGGKITGSPAYIAPESITEPEVDGRADLYSLGITIYRTATGRLPFVAKVPTEYLPMHLYNRPPGLRTALPEAPRELEEMVDKLLEKSPAKRFQSAGEALAFLRERVAPAVLRAGADSSSDGVDETSELAFDPTRADAARVPRADAPTARLSSLSAEETTRYQGAGATAQAEGGAPGPALAAAPFGAEVKPRLDPLGFTNSEMVAVALSGEGAPAEAAEATPDAGAGAATGAGAGGADGAAPEGEAQPGFFARIWAFFSRKKA